MTVDPYQNVPPGQSVAISCIVARGDPSYVSYTWTFLNQDRTTIGIVETSSILVVEDIQPENYGTYTCKVSNDAGSATADIVIGEGGKCIKPSVRKQTTKNPDMHRF